MNSSLITHHSSLSLAAVYRRVSTDHQDDSLLLQERRVLDYARFKNLTVSDGLAFSDPDTSGRAPMTDRIGGRALLNRLKHGDVQHLIVAKLDRLGRNVRDGLKTVEFLKEHNVTLHIVDCGGEAFSTQGHFGRFFLTMLLAMSEWEVEEIRDRTLKVARDKFDRNELTGNVPFGFDCVYSFSDGHVETRSIVISAAELSSLITHHSSLLSKVLVDNPREQAVIHLMHRLRWESAAGVSPASQRRKARSLKQVAEELNARGTPTKQGAAWSTGTVDSVLSSRHTQKVLAAQPLQTSAHSE